MFIRSRLRSVSLKSSNNDSNGFPLSSYNYTSSEVEKAELNGVSASFEEDPKKSDPSKTDCKCTALYMCMCMYYIHIYIYWFQWRIVLNQYPRVCSLNMSGKCTRIEIKDLSWSTRYMTCIYMYM